MTPLRQARILVPFAGDSLLHALPARGPERTVAVDLPSITASALMSHLLRARHLDCCGRCPSNST